MQLSSKIKRKLKELPDKPGCYIMRDDQGRIIYVGKAKSLRKRVQSYFRAGTLKSASPKVRGLIRSVDDFEVRVVRNEEEALLTEDRLVKDYHPRYNVLLRDDKRFLLLRVDMNEPFPRFSACRIRRDESATYFGPYASTAAARETLEFVEKRFGLRRCRPRVPGEADYTHCINDIVRFCSAPCIDKIDAEGYRERAAEACAFLNGERPELLKEVRELMTIAADALDFERAATLRDTLLHLESVVKLRARATRTPQMQAEDARRGIDELRDALSLPAAPRVIEAYDISNISGTHSVASMVCAVDGLPRPNRYRRFRIKSVAGPDDPASMAEVVRRRYTRVRDDAELALPDLVLVDGGITQLRAAKAELCELGLADQPIIGLAKRYEELFVDPESAKAVLRLPRDSAGLQVLTRLRDEAHRFALTYHRALRNRRIRESVLDDIEGIGDKRKGQLLAHFGSVNRLARASVDDIARVPGFGAEMARTIKERLER